MVTGLAPALSMWMNGVLRRMQFAHELAVAATSDDSDENLWAAETIAALGRAEAADRPPAERATAARVVALLESSLAARALPPRNPAGSQSAAGGIPPCTS